MNQKMNLKLVQVEDTEEVRALIPSIERFVDAFLYADEASSIVEMVKYRAKIHDWIRYCETSTLGKNLPAGYVPATQWLTVKIADDSSKVVGKISMRHYLKTHDLAEFLGHIGYAVHPDYRQQGIASWQLRACLAEIRNQVDSNQMKVRENIFCADGENIQGFPEEAQPITENLAVLLTCDDTNVGSYKTIENCGGIRDRNALVDNPKIHNFGTVKRRYWIELPASSESSIFGSTK